MHILLPQSVKNPPPIPPLTQSNLMFHRGNPTNMWYPTSISECRYFSYVHNVLII